MTRRTAGLEHGGLKIDFSSYNKCAKNCIETYSCFNPLMCHGFEGLVPEMLLSYNEFSANFNFHNNSL